MPARPQTGIVHDISYGGCKLEVPGAPLELGGTALLDVPGANRIEGRVVWAAGKAGGIQFDKPLGTPAAIVFGLEEPEPEPEPVAYELPEPRQPGLLSHWFRRLADCFS